MLRALIGGGRDPEVPAELAKGRLRKKVPSCAKARRRPRGRGRSRSDMPTDHAAVRRTSIKW